MIILNSGRALVVEQYRNGTKIRDIINEQHWTFLKQEAIV